MAHCCDVIILLVGCWLISLYVGNNFQPAKIHTLITILNVPLIRTFDYQLKQKIAATANLVLLLLIYIWKAQLF